MIDALHLQIWIHNKVIKYLPNQLLILKIIYQNQAILSQGMNGHMGIRSMKASIKN